MNAIQFIQQNGVEKAREVLSGAPDWAIFWITQGEYHISMLSFPNMVGHHSFLISDLKRLVESVDLVKSYGGIINAKHDVKYLDLDWDYDTPRVTRLKQAITDYESIENHVSPNCKVGVK